MKELVFCLLLCIGLSAAAMRKSSNKATWQDAARECESRGESLPNILTENQQIKLFQAMKSDKINLTWTGINRLDHKDNQKPWVWRYHNIKNDLDPLVNFFDKGEPNNYFGDEYCVAMRRVRGGVVNHGIQNWNDAQCKNTYYYYCDDIQK